MYDSHFIAYPFPCLAICINFCHSPPSISSNWYSGNASLSNWRFLTAKLNIWEVGRLGPASRVHPVVRSWKRNYLGHDDGKLLCELIDYTLDFVLCSVWFRFYWKRNNYGHYHSPYITDDLDSEGRIFFSYFYQLYHSCKITLRHRTALKEITQEASSSRSSVPKEYFIKKY